MKIRITKHNICTEIKIQKYKIQKYSRATERGQGILWHFAKRKTNGANHKYKTRKIQNTTVKNYKNKNNKVQHMYRNKKYKSTKYKVQQGRAFCGILQRERQTRQTTTRARPPMDSLPECTKDLDEVETKLNCLLFCFLHFYLLWKCYFTLLKDFWEKF